MITIVNVNNLLQLKKKKGSDKLHNRRDHELSYAIATQVVTEVHTQKQTETIEESLVLITGLFQTGGANSGAIGEAKFAYGDIELSAAELGAILTKLKPSATLRQLSRALAQDIISVALVFDIPGDLSHQFAAEVPNATREELAWASHFQKTNSACPERVKTWLRKTLSRKTS